MRRFDYAGNDHGSGYLLNVQSELLNELNTIVVVPLVSLATVRNPIRRLNPVFDIADNQFVMRTQFMSAMPMREFGTVLGSLSHAHSEIMNALDVLFSGM